MESVIISSIYSFAVRLLYYYRQSFVHRILSSITGSIKSWFSGSSIWGFISSNEKSSGFFENSLIIKPFQKILDFIVFIVRWMHDILDQPVKNSVLVSVASESIVGKFCKKAIGHFGIVIGLFILIQTVIPHDFGNAVLAFSSLNLAWHNQYGLLLTIAMAFLYLIKVSGDKRYGLSLKRMDFALLLFIGIVFLSSITSITLGSSIRVFIFNSMSFIVVFVVANAIKTEKELDRICYYIIAAISFASLLGLWQWYRHVPVDPRLVDVNFSSGEGRIFSTMENPNNYAEYLVMTIPFYAAAFFNTANKKVRVLIAALSTLPLLNLVLTISRSSWMGFAVAILVFVFFKKPKLIPLILIAGLLAIPFMPAIITNRLATIGKDSSGLYRFKIWEPSLRMLSDYWHSGIGLGSGPFVKLISRYSSLPTPPPHAHMLLLEIWLETGIAGILSFLWFITRMVKKGFKNAFVIKKEFHNNIIAACVSAIAGIFVAGAFEYVWFYPRVLTMFWVVAGILLASVNMLRIAPSYPSK
ncbi:MAG TPA: O-antigen ligase family protein [Clostridia bacterium]